MNFAANVRVAFTDAPYDGDEDQADTVETIIIIAGFAVAATAAISWVTTALAARAADASDCIQGYGESSCTSQHALTAGGAWRDSGSASARFGRRIIQ